MENTLPTAEEFLRAYNKLGKNNFNPTSEYDKTLWDNEVVNSLIEFAKLHVKAALKAASEKVSHKHVVYNATFEINKDSILNSYPIENVK